jgi:hypothetical protein
MANIALPSKGTLSTTEAHVNQRNTVHLGGRHG